MEGDIGGGYWRSTFEGGGAFDGDIGEAHSRGTLKGDMEGDIGRVHLRGALDHWRGSLEGDIRGGHWRVCLSAYVKDVVLITESAGSEYDTTLQMMRFAIIKFYFP